MRQIYRNKNNYGQNIEYKYFYAISRSRMKYVDIDYACTEQKYC